jgi:hypothetical protein
LAQEIHIHEGEETDGACVCCKTDGTCICCERKAPKIFACGCRKVGGRGRRGDERGEGGGLIKGKLREVCAKMSHKTTIELLKLVLYISSKEEII